MIITPNKKYILVKEGEMPSSSDGIFSPMMPSPYAAGLVPDSNDMILFNSQLAIPVWIPVNGCQVKHYFVERENILATLQI